MTERMKLALSQSTANLGLSRSWLHAWTEHWDGGRTKENPNANMIRGIVVETFLFNRGHDRLVLVPFADYKKDAAKDARDIAFAEGKIPVLEADYAYYKASAEKSRAKLAKDYGINFGPDSPIQTQVKFQWIDPATGCPCKAKLDGLVLGESTYRIYELKSTENAEPHHRERNVSDSGHDIQAAAYIEAVEFAYPHLAGKGSYRWLYCEPDPPHEICVAMPSGSRLEIGKSKWERAKAEWAQCLKTGIWPGYTKDTCVFEPESWELQQIFRNQHASTGMDIAKEFQ